MLLLSSSSGGLVSHWSCPTFVIIIHHSVWKVSEVGEGIVVIVHPPCPCVVIGHRMRVRASVSIFGANGLGGKVSMRELSSNHPSFISLHHQLVVIIWWGHHCHCCCQSSLTVLITLSLSDRGLIDVISSQAADDGCAVW